MAPPPGPNETLRLLLGAEDGVFGGLGDAELDDAFGGNLDLFTGGRVAANPSLPIHQDEFAQARECECVLGILVCQGDDRFHALDGLLLCDPDGFRKRCGDLRFR